MKETDALVVHCFHNPNGARLFVEPIVEALRTAGINAELWHGRDCKWMGTAARMNDEVVPNRIITFDTPPDPFRAAWRLLLFWRALRIFRPVAVHAHLTRAATIPLLAARLAGVKLRIYHNHGMAYLGRRGWQYHVLRIIELINHNLATHVLMVSHCNRNDAIADSIPDAERIVVIGHGSIAGIDIDQFSPASGKDLRLARETLGISMECLVIGFQGRASAHKGLDDLVAAFSKAGLDRTNAKIIVAGTDYSQARKLLKKRLPRWIICLGNVTDMPTFYRACDFVAVPSWYEGLSLAVLESAACGIPAIASDVPGLKSAMEAGSTGLLVPPRNTELLSLAIGKLASEPQLRKTMGAAARVLVEEKFERSKVLNETVRWTQKLLMQ